MPICYFRPRESAHDDRILGWVDLQAQSVHVLTGTIAELLCMQPDARREAIQHARRESTVTLPFEALFFLAPVDEQEIWAAGVTYERSRDARMEESTQQDVYDRVYDAERPEIFFKSTAARCMGHEQPVGIRADSSWDVPEPELAVVIDTHGNTAGYTVGNDVSSRSIEGENPLYLPQAKMYTACCALGPWIMLEDELPDPLALDITLTITRDGNEHFRGTSSTRQIHRPLRQLVAYLYDALELPAGAVLLTGTGIIPPSEFTLQQGDIVTIEVSGIGALTNHVYQVPSRRASYWPEVGA